jgi:hypothetical protein
MDGGSQLDRRACKTREERCEPETLKGPNALAEITRSQAAQRSRKQREVAHRGDAMKHSAQIQ